MSRVVITVGAQADRSLVDVVRPLVDSAKRARAQATADARAAARAQGEAARLAGRMQVAEFQAQAALHRQHIRARLQAERDAAKETTALQRRASQEAQRAEREKAKAVEHVYQIRQRAIAQQEREAATTARSRAQAALGYGAGAMRTLGGVARAGIGIASTLARGAGVNWDLGALIGNSVAQETKAANIANQATMAGQTVEGGAKGLSARTRGAAVGANVDIGQTFDVIGAFQAKSSDLATAEATVERLAKLAKISGTEFGLMGEAAGAVNAQLADTPDRADKLVAIMAHLTKQTADGSVEMSDYAKYVGVIAAQANAYEGTFEKNIGQLGALSQMAMKGGAYSAAMATNAAASFNRDITKDKTLTKWTGAGIDVFADKGKTKLKDVEELILAYVKKKGANRADLAQFFPNVVSKRAVTSSLDTYDAAEKKQKGSGEAAIRAEFQKFRATLDDKTVDKLYKDQEGTTANSVQKINNQLALMGEQLASKLLPKLIEGAPAIMKFVDSMVGAATWAADNPGKMIVLAITGSIAKAAIGSAVSSGLQTMLQATMAGAGSVGAMGGMGKAGAALGAIAIGVATFTITSAVIDIVGNAVDKGVNNSIAADANVGNAIGEANALARRGTGTEADVARIEGEKRALEARIEAAGGSRIAQYAQGALNPFSSQTLAGASEASNDAEKIGTLKADLAALTAALQGLQGSVKNGIKANVTVTQGSSPGVDPAGRK